MPPMPILNSSLVSAAVALAVGVSAHAQIITDGSVGPARSLTGPDHAIRAALGRQVGANLFHSFSSFNVAAGQSATFYGSGSEIRNVLSRVTGGSASTIDGLIRMDAATLPAANLFLINPKGILFGPNVQLDLTGSFHASTADYIKLGGGGRFDAADPARDVLTAAPPEAFGFLTASQAAIRVDGSDLTNRNERAGELVVRDGAGLSLVGGAIRLADATVHTIGGDVRMVAAASAGEVPLAARGSALAGSKLASIAVERSQVGSISGDTPPGRIVIRGGSVRILDSTIDSSNSSAVAAPPVELAAAEDLTVRTSNVTSSASGAGAGSEIRVSGRRITIDGRTQLATAAAGPGKGGDVAISAGERIDVVDIGDDPNLFTTISSTTSASAPGGELRLDAPIVSIDGGILYAETQADGRGGGIRIAGREILVKHAGLIYAQVGDGASGSSGDIRLDADKQIDVGGLDATGTFISAIVSETYGSGKAADMRFNAPQIKLTGALVLSGSLGSGDAGSLYFKGDHVRFAGGDGWGTQVESGVSEGFSGNGGNVVIDASRSFELDGTGFRDAWTRLAATTQGDGRGGEIIVTAPQVLIDRGTIFARSRFGRGLPGGITVTAQDSLLMRNEGGIGTHTEGERQGAAVTIRAGLLQLSDSSAIDSNTIGDGNAGTVTIQADRIRMTGASAINAVSGGGAGRAGDIVIAVEESFEMVERAVAAYQDLGGGGPRGADVWPGGINLAANGTGSAGNLVLKAGSIALDQGRIVSTAKSSGKGGRVVVEARSMALRNGAQIDAKSAPESSGDAGSIVINVGGPLEISGWSPIDGAFSGLYAQAQGSGAGGSIEVRADTLTLDRALIRSSTTASGSAGTIRIRSADVAVSNGGWIDAGTAPGSTGAGGSIDIQATRSFIVSGADRTPPRPFSAPTGPVVTPATPGREQGFFASTVSSNTAGAGPGGNVTLVSPSVTIADGGGISANSSASANAGSIVVDARPGSIWIDHGAVTTQAETSDGGNITLLAGNRLHIIRGEVSTSVGSGRGSGGNIFIDPTFVILESGRIAANAFGGAGGNIGVVASYFLASPNSTLEASSQLGVAGNVLVSAIQSEVVSALPVLPAQFFDASGVLREACTPRAAGSSRLVDVGRGGIQAATLGYSASRYFDDSPAPAAQALVPTRTAAARGQSVLLAGICGS